MKQRAARVGGCLFALVALLAACGGDEARKPADVTHPVDAEVLLEVEVLEDAAVEVELDAEGEVEGGGPEVDGEGDAEVEPDVPVDPASTGFPAQGVLIRILEPGAHGVAVATGPTIIMSGILFGNATAIVWQAGAQSGSATPGRFWQTGPITLVPGDNRVSVTATDGARSVGDSVVVTYNPAFRFDENLSARPSVLWTGVETEVVFAVALTRSGQVDLGALKLVQVSPDGESVGEVGVLADNGRLSESGDEIEQDGVFTRTARFTCTGQPLYFRATAAVTGQTSYTAVSPIVRVDCLERLAVSSCEAKKSILAAAGSALEGGAAASDIAGQLRGEAAVAEAGVSEDGSRAVWIVFDDGVLGAALAPRVGTRGGAEVLGRAGAMAGLAASGNVTVPVLSKRALVLSPAAAEFGEGDESDEVAARLSGLECPSYEVETGAAITGAGAGLGRLRGLSGYGVATLATHGAELFTGMSAARMRALRWAHIGPQEVLWSGSEVDCAGLLQAQTTCVVTSQAPMGGCPSGTRCLVTKGVASDTGSSGQGVRVDETQEDLRLGRVVMTNRGYAVTPSFFSAWRGRGFPASLVHLGACSSMRNGSLASALYAAGARGVSGFSGAVGHGFAREVALGLVESAAGGTLSDVVTRREDPEHAGTMWRVFGATNLSLAGSEVINSGFEQGLTGWRTGGDGRVVSRFGTAQPVSGKSMGLVSTGLGFSLASGELRQTFCVPEGATRLTFNWKFVSEEFKEWCGTAKFQDRFSATLIDETGAVNALVDVSVDDLCGYADGTCAACTNPRPCDATCEDGAGCYDDGGVCGGEFNCQCGREFTGLSVSPIGFDQGGVYEVMWRRAERDVERFAGRRPVTLVLSVLDLGDSLFDTAVLVDEIGVD